MSSFAQLLGFALVAVGVGWATEPAAGLVVGGFSLVFVGHYADDAAARRTFARVRFRRRRQVGGKKRSSSPHPPIVIDPEMDRAANRAAAQRVRRGDGRIRDGIR